MQHVFVLKKFESQIWRPLVGSYTHSYWMVCTAVMQLHPQHGHPHKWASWSGCRAKTERVCVQRSLASVPVSRLQDPKITAANTPSLLPYCTLFRAYRLYATYATKYCVGVCCCMWEIQENCTIASTHCTEHLVFTPTIKHAVPLRCYCTAIFLLARTAIGDNNNCACVLG